MSFINQTKAHLWDANFWGPVTATLDWCEANYQFSRYIAESANTFSNLITVSLALWGAQQTRSAGLPSRYLVGYAGFALVGLGSMIFHATLLYEAQLADELPMIYVATYCSAVLLDTRPGFTKSFRTLSLVAAYFLFNIFFTWSYSVYRNPVYHQIVFATIMLSTAVRTRYLLNNFTVEKPTSHKITHSQKRTIGRIFLAGAGIFVFGFFIWNLDNIFCNTITNWKVSVGWPVAFLLEGHSWWHVFTATGTYLMIVGNTCKP
ncbi:alkaline phytoceramidase [Abortiporus biennis]|nr:alkaline phytoceramidase [Abortiporus biennis]